MKTNLVALFLILAAALWRVALVSVPALSNVAPITALALCGAVYFRDWRWWLVPFAAITLSDLWIDHYYATRFGIGCLVARRRTAFGLVAGTLGNAILFYLVTNTGVWAHDAYYAKTLAGWCQALTVGHPEFPPTLWFFRNTLLGDLLFTGLFAFAVKPVSSRNTIAPVCASQ
jgi:hypothetical protein